LQIMGPLLAEKAMITASPETRANLGHWSDQVSPYGVSPDPHGPSMVSEAGIERTAW